MTATALPETAAPAPTEDRAPAGRLRLVAAASPPPGASSSEPPSCCCSSCSPSSART
ncbi:hypothetical protein ACFQ1I_44615 [Kitasatospora arboriphila]